MAELTGDVPLEADVVTCRCGLRWDRNIYSLCSDCACDLWNLDPSPAPPAGGAEAAGHTVLEGPPSAARIEILACGRRLGIDGGRSLPLGRRDDLETAEVFREAKNVSREHAILRFEDGTLFVTDTSSSNGTFVDGQQLPPATEYELRPGQTLRLASNVAIEILWEP